MATRDKRTGLFTPVVRDYIDVARGWESKEIESQIEAAEARAAQSHNPQLSAAELHALRQRESLELSRTRVLQDLAAAKNPKYREMLERSLRYLEEKIAALTAD